jgi:hypothetical protein
LLLKKANLYKREQMVESLKTQKNGKTDF